MEKKELSEMVSAFTSGRIFSATDATLDKYLSGIIDRDSNKLYESGGQLRPEVVPAMVGVILSIKQGRLIEAIDRKSQKTQRLFLFVAIATMLISGLGVAVTIWLQNKP